MYIRLIFRIFITVAVLAPLLLYNRGDLTLRWLDRLEAFAYDARLLLTMPQTPDDRVVIVDIDETSIAKEGQWPWGRNKLALLINNLFEKYQVKVVGFDIVFAEPDRGSGLTVLASLADGSLAGDEEFLAQLPDLRLSLDWDNTFAESLRERNTVMGFVFRENSATEPIGMLPAPALGDATRAAEIDFRAPVAYTGNYHVLQSAARTGGFFDNPTVDADGVYRRVPVLQMFEGSLYESLALAVARIALDAPPIEFVFHGDEHDSLNLDWLRIGSHRVPVDGEGTVLVPYRGRQYSFPYVPASDVIDGTAPMYPLKGAIVLVGTSAPGLHDLRVTPVAEKYNGVEVHANIVSGILDDRIMHHPRYVQGVEIALLVVLAVLVTWMMARTSVVTATLLAILIMVSLAALNLLMWNRANFVIPLAPAMVFVFLTYLLQLIYGFFIETRGKRQLSALFGQYVPPELVEEMDTDPGGFDMESDSRDMTVLFTDVRGFTSIAETLEPRELSQFMNEFLTPMTQIIHRHRGTIDKYMGDAIMAFWGAPLADPEHARHALEASLDMQKALLQLNPTLAERGWPEIRIGVGLNSGTMRVGNMGSQFRMAYTVMGDEVNLGARLESLTKQYGVDIAVGENTARSVPDHIFLELDLVRVKGKDRPTTVFEPLGHQSEVSAEHKSMAKQLRRALRLYRDGEWDHAEKSLFMLHQAHPERRIFQIYLDRIAYFRAHPPVTEWDGVFTQLAK